MHAYKSILLLLLAAAALAVLAGCGDPNQMGVAKSPAGAAAKASDSTAAPAPATNGLTAGGSTFIGPMMIQWTNDFYKSTNEKVNYQATGSGAGISNFSKGLLHFAATDAFLNESQLKDLGGNVLHIPAAMGAVALTYNLPGLKQPLRLDGAALAKIFLGEIKKWNDPALASLNPGAALPDAEILVVHRSDGSGTTAIFTDYLSKVSPQWKSAVGANTAVKWPTGQGGKANAGVASLVQRTPNAIGYVELLFALENSMPTAELKNLAGKFVSPDPANVTAAAGSLPTLPDDLRLSITEAPGETAYPISGITWLLVRKKDGSPETAAAVRKFAEFILSDAQQEAAAGRKYSKLPPPMLAKARVLLATAK